MFKWLTFVVVGLIVTLVGVAGLIGSRLPLHHSASRKIRLAKPADDVWRIVTDFAHWPDWNREVKSMNRAAGDREIWVMDGKTGRMPSEIIECTAPRLVTRIADESLPFGGTWTWEIQPAGDGCTVQITEDGQIKNAIFRFMARYAFGYTATMEGFLKALSAKYGEPVTFVDG